MKKALLSLLVLAMAKTGFGQTYSPIATASTGFNIDAVAETTTALLTTSGPIDGSNFVLYSAAYGALFSPAGTGLPNSGTIVNGTRTYQMKPYTQNNLVYLLAGQVDSIMLINPTFYSAISTLNFGTEGSPTMSITIRFTDNTIQTFANQVVPDWFSGTGAILTGFDRVSRAGTNPAYAAATDPRMHASHFHLSCSNRAKQVKTVIIKNNGTAGRLCVAAISGAALPVYTASITNIACAASTSSATIVSTGGLPPFTYNWGTSPVQTAVTATGLAVGSYSYSVTDAVGCVFSSTAIMPPTTGSQAAPVMLPFQNPVCSGQSLTFNATGAASYTWTGGVTNGIAFTPTTSSSPLTTDYTVTGANSCNTSTNSTVVSLTVNPNPVVTASSSSPTLCTGGSVTLTAAGAASYTWSGGVTDGVGFTPPATGNYTVIGMSSLNCASSAVVGITVLITPTAVPVAQPSFVCLGSTTTLTAAGATSYTWLPGNQTTASITVSPASASTYTVIKSNGTCSDTKTISVAVNLPPVVTASANPAVVCAGSTSTLNASSSVAGSTFTWYPSNATGAQALFNPAAAMVCTVVAFDGTCPAIATVSLSTIPVPTLIAVASDTDICAGESVTLSVSGATSYVWMPGGATTPTLVVSPTAPIQYSVTGPNSQGCFALASQIVVVYPSPLVTVSSSDPLICNGGVVTLSVSGGNTYTWSTNAITPTISVSPAISTIYSVICTNLFSCTTTGTIGVDVFNPTLSISGNTAVCDGQSTLLTASGANTYTWSTGDLTPSASVTPLSNTLYTLTAITASGNVLCSSTASFQVNVNPNPTVNVVSSKAVICRNEVVTFTASGATTYSWNTNAATTPTISMSSTVITTLFVNVTGTDANGCSATKTISVKVDGCTGIDEMAQVSAVNIYPNPNNGQFTIQSSHDLRVKLVNALGQVVNEFKLTPDNDFKVEVSGLAKGIYFIQAETDSNTMSKKVIIR